MTITGRTRVLAVLGDPVAHSRSPELHNRWLRALNLDAVYVALRCPASVDPTALVRGGLWGANLTAPLKRRATPDRWTGEAAETDAVNTLWWDGEVLVGDNTDVEGFRQSAEAALGPLVGQRAAVLGAGGAARAVLAALRRAGVDHVAVVSRRPTDLDAERRPFAPGALDDATLVVNATPASADADVSALGLPRRGAWIDLGYGRPFPWASHLVARGLRHVDGLPMLRAQAALAFARWTGQPPPNP